jgi:aminomethyltransferase
LAFGADMWYENNPFEVGYHYTWMVDLEQDADFMGKAALARIKAEGVKRKLVGVDIEGESLGSYIDNEMPDVFPVSVGGQAVGRVTSACHSPRLERNIGFAMLPIEHTELGTSLEVETPVSGKVAATVVQMPHWDPNKDIPKQ